MQYFKMLHATGGTQAVVNALGNTARENAPRQKAPAAVVVAAVPSTNAPVAPVAPPATVLMIEKSTAFSSKGPSIAAPASAMPGTTSTSAPRASMVTPAR